MRRGAVAAALLGGLAIAGCGGGDEPVAGAPVIEQPTQEAPPPPRIEVPRLATPRDVESAKRRLTTRRRGERKRSTARRGKLVGDVGRATLELLKLGDGRVQASADGRTVSVQIPRARACSAQRGDSARIASGIRAALSFVRSVRVTVLETRQSLAKYRKSHCKPKPKPRPEVIYAKTGYGHFTSPEVNVTGERWKLEFGTDGDFLSITVRKGSEVVATIERPDDGIGQRGFTGPGTFTIEVFASGSWSLRAVPR